MPIKNLRELMLLLTLYEYDKVSIQDIAEMLGIHESNTYSIKKRFQESGFLSEDGGIYRKGGYLKLYKVNHGEIDYFCVKNTPLHYFWRRAVNTMSIFQGSNPDWEKIKSWLHR